MHKFNHHVDRGAAKYLGKELRRLRHLVGAVVSEDSPLLKEIVFEIERLAYAVDESIFALLERLEMREAAARRREQRELATAMRHEQALKELTLKIVAEDYESVLAKSFEAPFAIHSGFYVYILWGQDEGQPPVYVGKSINVVSRIQTHLRDKEKRKLVKKIQLLRCETQRLMDQTELRLIRHYQPMLNKAGL